MPRVTVRLYGELNDFVGPRQRQLAFTASCQGRPSVKDLVEGLGVPHPEIDLILINQESAAFSDRVTDGDRISVYPRFRSIDVSAGSRVRVDPSVPARFALDAHLGRLARYLRLLGFDGWYERDVADPRLVEVGVGEGRILLTRDRALLKHGSVEHGYYVRETLPRLQCLEVIQRFDLLRNFRPFTRCLRCNGMLRPVSKDEIIDRLEPRTRTHFDEFIRCDGCGRVYWRGSHAERLARLVAELTQAASAARSPSVADGFVP